LHREAKWNPDPNGNSTDFLPGVMMTQGCGFGCTYCYTERHYINNYPKLYDDVGKVVDMIDFTITNAESLRSKMKAVAKKDYEKYRDPLHGDWITFDLGCDSDCVLDNQLTAHDNYSGHVIDIMNKVSLIGGAKTSFATKSSAFSRFLTEVERPSHHRIRLSLMPEHHRKVLEINTATISDRLAAINKLVARGFEVHINLSPIVVTAEFQSEYSDLLQLIDASLSQQAKDQMAYEIIFLTHTYSQYNMVEAYAPKAHKMMTKGPLQLVPKPTKAQVLSYSVDSKRTKKKALLNLIQEITPYSRVRYFY
jgi:spore photoproduct lyase